MLALTANLKLICDGELRFLKTLYENYGDVQTLETYHPPRFIFDSVSPRSASGPTDLSQARITWFPKEILALTTNS